MKKGTLVRLANLPDKIAEQAVESIGIITEPYDSTKGLYKVYWTKLPTFSTYQVGETTIENIKYLEIIK